MHGRGCPPEVRDGPGPWSRRPRRPRLARPSPRPLTQLGFDLLQERQEPSTFCPLPGSVARSAAGRCPVTAGCGPVARSPRRWSPSVSRFGVRGGRRQEASRRRLGWTAQPGPQGCGLAGPATNVQQRGHLRGNRAGLPNDTQPPEPERCGAGQRRGIVPSVVAEHLGLRLVPQPPVQLDDDPELLVEDVPVGGPRVEGPGGGLPGPPRKAVRADDLGVVADLQWARGPGRHVGAHRLDELPAPHPGDSRHRAQDAFRGREAQAARAQDDLDGRCCPTDAIAARSRTVCSTVSTGGRRLGCALASGSCTRLTSMPRRGPADRVLEQHPDGSARSVLAVQQPPVVPGRSSSRHAQGAEGQVRRPDPCGGPRGLGDRSGTRPCAAGANALNRRGA